MPFKQQLMWWIMIPSGLIQVLKTSEFRNRSAVVAESLNIKVKHPCGESPF